MEVRVVWREAVIEGERAWRNGRVWREAVTEGGRGLEEGVV